MSKEVARVDVEALPTLELDDLSHEGEAELVARGAAYAAEYERIQGKATALLKNLATVVVALRVQHGDMRGTSHEYRQVVAAMYRQSGIGPDSSGSLQTAVRWHVSNVLRRHMTPRELEAHNLLPTSALERLQDARKHDASLIKAIKAADAVAESKPARTRGKAAEESAGQEIRATADHLRLAAVVQDIMGKMDASVIKRHMTDGQRSALDAELARLEKRIASLRKLTRKPSSRA